MDQALGQSAANLRSPESSFAEFNLQRQSSFDDLTDAKKKYKYIFFSPNIEVFARLHMIFKQVPQIHRNIEQQLEDKQSRRSKHRGRRSQLRAAPPVLLGHSEAPHARALDPGRPQRIGSSSDQASQPSARSQGTSGASRV